MMDESVKLPPHDLDAEEAVLGSCLIDPEAIHKLSISSKDFYREKNHWTFEAMEKCLESETSVNQITVAHELAKVQRLEAAGGAAYLSHLVAQVPTSVHAEYYADIVKKHSLNRQLITAANQIANLAYQGDGALDQAEDLIANLRKESGGAKYLTPQEWADHAFKVYSNLHTDTGKALKFGLPKLDRHTGGIYPGEFWLLAARPGVGKSTLLRQFARNFSSKGNVLYVSIEEMTDQVTHRFISTSQGLQPMRLREGNFTESEWEIIQEGIAKVSERGIYLYVDNVITTKAISTQVSRIKAKHGLSAVMVDYVQLLSDKPGTKSYERVSYISWALANMARENEIIVFAASQLNRELEKGKGDKKPHLHELKDSGSLEQDAAGVLLLYRADAYEGFDDPQCPPGQARLFLAKHRPGAEVASISLKWLPKTQEYGELAMVEK